MSREPAVFLSHNGADKPAVEELKRRLEDASPPIHCWIDAEDVKNTAYAADTLPPPAQFGLGCEHAEAARKPTRRAAQCRGHCVGLSKQFLGGGNGRHLLVERHHEFGKKWGE